MTTIDSHFHLGLNGFSLQKLIRYLDSQRIDACWLLAWEETAPGPWGYRHLAVEDIYEASAKYPSRIIPFYAPDPHRIDASSVLEHWHGKGVRGCGELKATLRWDSDEAVSLLATVDKLRMPVVFHMEESEIRDIPYSDSLFDRLLFHGLRTTRAVYKVPQGVLTILTQHYAPLRDRKTSYVFPGYMLDFAALEHTLRTFPTLNLVAHGPMFWKNIAADAATRRELYPSGPVTGEGIIWRLLREYPNLYADTSAKSGLNALARDTDNARRFLSEFGDKILYGTDNVLAGQREFINSLGLSAAARRSIMSANAQRLIHE